MAKIRPYMRLVYRINGIFVSLCVEYFSLFFHEIIMHFNSKHEYLIKCESTSSIYQQPDCHCWCHIGSNIFSRAYNFFYCKCYLHNVQISTRFCYRNEQNSTDILLFDWSKRRARFQHVCKEIKWRKKNNFVGISSNKTAFYLAKKRAQNKSVSLFKCLQ